MKKYLRKSLIPFVIIFATCVEGSSVTKKNYLLINTSEKYDMERWSLLAYKYWKKSMYYF